MSLWIGQEVQKVPRTGGVTVPGRGWRLLEASLIHSREVFRPATTQSAAAIILVHNHPSGDPTPSAEDRAVTKQLSAVGRTVGISVVDHVVIGDGSFVSLADEGALG